MAKTKGARTIGAHIPNELADLINARAQRLNWSESKYVREILERWQREGAPFVSELDAVAEKIAKKPAR